MFKEIDKRTLTVTCTSDRGEVYYSPSDKFLKLSTDPIRNFIKNMVEHKSEYLNKRYNSEYEVFSRFISPHKAKINQIRSNAINKTHENVSNNSFKQFNTTQKMNISITLKRDDQTKRTQYNWLNRIMPINSFNMEKNDVPKFRLLNSSRSSVKRTNTANNIDITPKNFKSDQTKQVKGYLYSGRDNCTSSPFKTAKSGKILFNVKMYRCTLILVIM